MKQLNKIKIKYISVVLFAATLIIAFANSGCMKKSEESPAVGISTSDDPSYTDMNETEQDITGNDFKKMDRAKKWMSFLKSNAKDILKSVGDSSSVEYQLYINERGLIDKIRVIKGLGSKLDKRLAADMEDWSFEPAVKDGMKVKYQMPWRQVIKITDDGNSVSGYNPYISPGVTDESKFDLMPDKDPQPVGGGKAIAAKIRYPELAKKAGIEGKVSIKTFIDSNGNVVGGIVLTPLGAGLDESAYRAIKQTKFKPGIKNGKPVNTQIVIPVYFQLDSATAEVSQMGRHKQAQKKSTPKKNEPSFDENIFFVAVEEMPEPIGGIAAIQKKIVYPAIAKKAGIEGKVYVKAFIDKNGDVVRAEIIKGLGAGCDEAAIKAIKDTKFKPGRQRGKPVNVQVSIPVIFRLE